MPRQPETLIRNELITYLQPRGWYIEILYGSRFQKGVPDLFLFHREHGFRWVDVKNPRGYRLTIYQQQKWPRWEAAGLGVWILTAATDDEYAKLFAAPNWRAFWRPQPVGQLDRLWKDLVQRGLTRVLSAFAW